MAKTFLIIGAINALLCILLGAFGAHGLKQILSADMLAVYHTGVQYHFYHATGLMLVGLVLQQYANTRIIKLSGWLMLTGIIFFSMSLYFLSLTGMRVFAMITPFGGGAFIGAWTLLAYGLWRQN